MLNYTGGIWPSLQASKFGHPGQSSHLGTSWLGRIFPNQSMQVPHANDIMMENISKVCLLLLVNGLLLSKLSNKLYAKQTFEEFIAVPQIEIL